ncbi:g8818 [Coccomyxa viridis]|uniref:G8818 protein n=1 Tax=Coccomyxa viridis TaxID=1274662 RepID=A0ABP1G2F0_9CHLO
MLAQACWSAGEKFLAVPSSTIAEGACPQLSSFWANLQQHLTELMIEVQPGKGNKQLESLGSLTALKLLMILPEGPYRPGPPRYDMSGAKLVLNLPNLVFLFVCSLSNGELVLSGPRVEHAWFMNNKSFKVSMMELHDLDCLIMKDCKEIQVAGDALEKQFPKFKSLIVSRSSEVGRLVLEDIGKMQRLVRVSYSDFRASRMPASFPQSLEDIHLNPSGWFRDLPAGLKQCTKLKTLDFCTNRESVYFTKPWTELVPTDSLEKVSLGQTEYVRESDAGKAVFKQVSRLGDIMGL